MIAFAYDGLEGMRVSSDGVLVLTTSVGEVLELRPEVCYTDGGHELTIDPVLVTGTYSGATGSSNYGHFASNDGFGNIYTGARNSGPTYPASVGVFQISFGGGGTDVSLSNTISQYSSAQRCAAIFSQDDPRRSLRSRSYGTTSSEK